MSDPALLQTGPETFRVMLGDGRSVNARLAHHTRRGLGLQGTPPLTIATEMVRFLLEQGYPVCDDLDLGPAVGRHPGAIDELRSRLG